MESKKQQIEELVWNFQLRESLQHHFNNPDLLDFKLARRLKEILPGDVFTISQFLLGIDYYQARLSKIFKTGETFLDVGCGAGNWSFAAARTFVKVKGTDLNSARIQAARQLTPELAANKDVQFDDRPLNQQTIEPHSVDACFCFNVMSFIDYSHVDLLKEIRGLIKPDGQFYIAVTGPGFLPYLGVQCLFHPSGTKDFLSVLYRNLKYLLGIRKQPQSWVSLSYIQKIASQSGWRIVHSGREGDLSPKLIPLFAKSYAGLPLMREFVLVPV